jgi:syntaxin-binding protein 1
MRTLHIDFTARESHLGLFNDPWSFPVLFHPVCNNLIRPHLEALAQKILSVCICLGEYPIVRYYKPKAPTHEAGVLCTHLANFVQRELDEYVQYHQDFPPISKRPRGTLIITDRTMDLFAPLLHEFTYQAMAHDLLPIREGDKVTFTTVINQGEPGEEEKEMEIGEADRVWVENRHRHMMNTIDKLTADFNKFMQENAAFADEKASKSVHAIKGMLAGLTQFQAEKATYSLHLTMAQECMDIFEKNKLPDMALLEQVCCQ